MRTRQALLTSWRDAPPAQPVLIIGGGINGIGVYRDLAAQGVPALLVEREDFCSGTSAAPSRLAHGGLRYLETGEFALVRESVEERNRLLHNAPHLVRPLPVWLPLRSRCAGLWHAPLRLAGLTRTPGAKGSWVTRAGLLCYDLFGRRVPALPRHRMVGRGELRRALPGIEPGVFAAAEYHDARLVHPERLALELVADAEADCTASAALNWVAVEGLADGGAGVRLRDTIDGQSHVVFPRLVVNTAGCWVDQVLARLGIDERLMGGTRGAHLVLRQPALAQALDGRMLYFETADHRICLVYPLREDLLLLGTTDLRTDDPDDRRCTEPEIDYLFEVLGDLLPGIRPTRADIVYRYAGVRPLPRSDAAVAGAISRDHQLRVHEADSVRPWPLLSLVGGKWTTYRACAAQITDAVLARLGRTRTRSTATLPIGGGRDWPADAGARIRTLARQHGLSESVVAPLWARYGQGCQPLLEHLAAPPHAASPQDTASDPLAPVGDHAPAYRHGELTHIVRHERVGRLADLVLRRTLLAFHGHCDAATLDAWLAVCARELGWTAARCAAERADTEQQLAQRHGVTI